MIELLAQSQGIGMPPQASTFPADVDWLWNFLIWVSVFFTVLISGLVIFFCIKFKRKTHDDLPHGAHHSTTLELGWSIPPLIIVLATFVWGFRGYLDIYTPDGNDYEVLVTAYKWGWSFTHPDGTNDSALHIPADQAVTLVLESQDVIHSLYIPAFRAKKDAVPGRYNRMWFRAPWNPELAARNDAWDRADTMMFDLFCTEYCGTSHSTMITKVYVHQPDSFAAYLEEANKLPENLIVAGEMLYTSKTCFQCHSLDGTRANGPSFKNIFGETHVMRDGEEVLVNEDYLRESILYPNARILAGYQPVMPRIALREEEVTALILFIKSQSDSWTGGAFRLDADGNVEEYDPETESTADDEPAE